MSYQLRLHRLIEVIPHTHRYHVTDFGLAAAVFVTRAHARFTGTGLADLAGPDPPPRLRRAITNLDNNSTNSPADQASGNPDALRGALRLLAHEGTVLVASQYGVRDAVLPLCDLFHRRRLTIRSTQVSTIPTQLSSRGIVGGASVLLSICSPRCPSTTWRRTRSRSRRGAQAFAVVDAPPPGLIHAALSYA